MENTIYEGKYSMWKQTGRIIWIVFWLLMILVSIRDEDGGTMIKFSLVMILPALILILIDVFFTKMIVTDTTIKGVAGTRFLFGKTTSLPVATVTSVEVKQGILGTLLKYGTVVVNTPTGEVKYNYIKDTRDVESAIMQALKR